MLHVRAGRLLRATGLACAAAGVACAVSAVPALASPVATHRPAEGGAIRIVKLVYRCDRKSPVQRLLRSIRRWRRPGRRGVLAHAFLHSHDVPRCRGKAFVRIRRQLFRLRHRAYPADRAPARHSQDRDRAFRGRRHGAARAPAALAADTWPQGQVRHAISCPRGTIPMRRITLAQLTRFATLAAFLRKTPGGARARQAAAGRITPAGRTDMPSATST
jgi:hypothetical protein